MKYNREIHDVCKVFCNTKLSVLFESSLGCRVTTAENKIWEYYDFIFFVYDENFNNIRIFHNFKDPLLLYSMFVPENRFWKNFKLVEMQIYKLLRRQFFISLSNTKIDKLSHSQWEEGVPINFMSVVPSCKHC